MNKFRINFIQLNQMNLPIGANIVVYNREAKRAVFLHKKENDFFEIRLIRNKRAKKIGIRDKDYVFLCHNDGSLEKIDLSDIFCIGQEKNCTYNHQQQILTK